MLRIRFQLNCFSFTQIPAGTLSSLHDLKQYSSRFRKYIIWIIAQNAAVFRDMYLQCPVYQRVEYQFACLELVSCDWSTVLSTDLMSSMID